MDRCGIRRKRRNRAFTLLQCVDDSFIRSCHFHCVCRCRRVDHKAMKSIAIFTTFLTATCLLTQATDVLVSGSVRGVYCVGLRTVLRRSHSSFSPAAPPVYQSVDGKGGRMLHAGSTGQGPRESYNCSIIPTTTFFVDIDLRNNVTAVGNTVDQVPFYSRDTGEILGYYTGEETILPGDSIGTVVYSFGEFPSRPFLTQISSAFTRSGAYNSITGGNGRYGCAEGYIVFLSSSNSTQIDSDLYVCGTLCRIQ